VSYAVFSLVYVAVVNHASFRPILLSLARFICVNCSFGTKVRIFFLISRMSIVTVVLSSFMWYARCVVYAMLDANIKKN
jgi:hypothetical protein